MPLVPSTPENFRGDAPVFPLSLLWQGLLDTLVSQGFNVGVAQTLRLEALLRRLPLDTPPARLKYLLAPLFVTEEAQQEKFYRLCDAYLESYAGKIDKPDPIDKPLPPSRSNVLAVVGVVVLILCVLSIGPARVHFFRTQSRPPIIPVIQTTITGGTTQTSSGPKTNSGTTNPTPSDNTRPPDQTPSGTEPGVEQPKTVPHDPVNFQFPIEIQPRHLDTSHAYSILLGPSLWEKYGWKLWAPLILLPPLLLWFVARLRRRRNTPKRRKPPFRWPLNVDPPERSIHDQPLMLDTARRMRTRQIADYALLNINQSIDRTIGAGGFPTLVERPALRRPEYLVLLDRRSTRDHLAAFYADLVHAFQREGIHADYYYFDDDLRLCRREDGEESVELSALTAKFAASHRLLIIADGNRLLDPVTGLLPDWAVVFQKWKERALFVSEALSDWSVNELAGPGQFWLFPADFRGLRDFLERLSGEDHETLDGSLASSERPAPYLPESYSKERLPILFEYLGPSAFIWLCVCALYPELRWNLTLYLGALPSLPPDTRSRENILRLARLSWFRAGVIPESWRWELMSHLDDDVVREAREAIAHLMERDPPPPGSYADEAFQLELALQRWAAYPTRETRRQLSAILLEMDPNDILRRVTLVKLLQTEKPRSFLHLISRLGEKLFREKGIRELGLSGLTRVTMCLLLIFAGCLTIILIHTPLLSSPMLAFHKGGLDFGSYETELSANANLVFQNETDKPFTIHGLHLQQNGEAFSLGATEKSFQVPAHKNVAIPLQYHPVSKGQFAAKLHIIVDGPRHEYVIPFQGNTSDTPDLKITPSKGLFFASIELNKAKALHLTNKSEKTAHLKIALDNPTHFGFAKNAVLERDIKFNNTVDVPILYHATLPGAHTSRVDITCITGSHTSKYYVALYGGSIDIRPPLPFVLKKHTSFVYSVAYSFDNHRIVTGSNDKTAIIWDAMTGHELFALKGGMDAIWSVAFSHNSRRVITGNYDHNAKVWDAVTGKELFTLKGHTSIIWAVSYSPDDNRIVTGSGDNTAKVWDAVTGKELFPLIGHTDFVLSVAYSPDGNRIVTGSRDNTAKVWDAVTGKELFTLKGHTGPIDSVSYSPDGNRIVTGSGDNTAKVWDAVTGKELFPLIGHTDFVLSVAYSPDGNRIVTGSRDNTAKVWDAVTGKELFTLKGHVNRIWSVVYSPDGHRIVTGSEDKTAIIWDVSDKPNFVQIWPHTAAQPKSTTEHNATNYIKVHEHLLSMAEAWAEQSKREQAAMRKYRAAGDNIHAAAAASNARDSNNRAIFYAKQAAIHAQKK